MRLHDMTLTEVSGLLDRGEVTPEEVCLEVINRIDQVEGKVKGFITLDKDAALEAARALNGKKRRGPLDGIPYAIKDVICTKGTRTTCGSRILETFVPPYDAAVVEHLQRQGAISLGKTNMDEFAMGSSCENSAFFCTRNPWDLQRVPGGSSGGSAAVVAAGEAWFSLGSDTGGSVRQPASLCGVVGMKPTYGRVSRYGLIAFASSLDQIGPFAKDVTDCALVLEAIAGHDPRDSTSADIEVPSYTRFLTGDIKGMRLGLPSEYLGEGTEPGVREVILKAAQTLDSLGASVEECSLPHTEAALSAYYLIAPAEASSNLARYDGVRYGFRADSDDLLTMYKETRRRGFGAEVKRRIMLGTYALSSGYYDAYYLRAQRVRTLVRRDFDRAFQRFDALVAPTSPTVAFKVGEKVDDPLTMYLSDVCTIPANLAGIPGMSVPAGFSQGMPVGLQILGKPFDEGTILRVGYAFEQASGVHKARAQLKGGQA